MNVFLNYSKSVNCTDLDEGNEDPFGWNYQVCNEMIMPISSNGFTDMFLTSLWDPDTYYDNCVSQMGLKPQFTWALDTFGGRNPQKDFAHYSNIILTNGNLDPWRAGGVNYDIKNDKISVFLMNGAAHHLDLREPNDEKDPDDVKTARAAVIQKLKDWIKDWNAITQPSLYRKAEETTILS
jgi:lysosomal Pro-X carboxypeptidase